MAPHDTEHISLVIPPTADGVRVDRFLAQHLPELSRQGAARIIADGAVLLTRPGQGHRRRARKGDRLQTADVLWVLQDDATRARANPVSASPQPKEVEGIRLVHRDEHLLVLCKPSGVPTHPLIPGETGTVANHVVWIAPECLTVGAPPREGGLCHRLDTLTSGLMIAALSPMAYQSLRRQFQTHGVRKTYLALVQGAPPEHGEIIAGILSRRGRRRVAVGDGQLAHTRYRVCEHLEGAALVEAVTHYGRHHQIRAHLAAEGHPLVADVLYGGEPHIAWQAGPLLHALRIDLEHPGSDEPVSFEAPLSSEQLCALARLRHKTLE